MAENPIPQQELLNRIYFGKEKTGDNIEAIRSGNYVYDEVNSEWVRANGGLVPVGSDYVGFSDPDGNDNYQTIIFNTGGSGGTTVATLSLTYDGSSNVTSITRT